MNCRNFSVSVPLPLWHDFRPEIGRFPRKKSLNNPLSGTTVKGMISSLTGIGRAAVLRAVMLAFSALVPSIAVAAPPIITIGTASGLPGSAVDLPVMLTTGDTNISATQFDFSYSSPNLVLNSVTIGTAGSAAGKDVASAAVAGGQRVLVFGFNQNVIGAGELAVLHLQISPSAAPGSYPVTILPGTVFSSDPAGNSAPTNFASGSMTVTSTDTAPPVRSNGSPTATLPAGTVSTTIGLNTNENATCKYATSQGVPFAVMSLTMAGAGTTTHSAVVGSAGSPLQSSNRYYVRCSDSVPNVNTTDFEIVVNVGSAPPPQDLTPPVRSAGSPVGTLPAGTTQATLSLSTNESASCKFATSSGVSFNSMAGTFTASGGGLSHSAFVTGLTNGSTNSYFVRCRDGVGNDNGNDFIISFSVAVPVPPQDLTPPVRTNGNASGALPPDVVETTIAVITNEAAVCRFGGTAGEAFGSMPGAMGSSDGLNHSATITGLENGTTNVRYVRCQDLNSNANPDDFTISFTVAAFVPVAFHDFNGDLNSEISLSKSGSVRVLFANGDLPGLGGTASQKLNKKALVGIGHKGKVPVVTTALKEKGKWRWEQLDLATGKRKKVATFGSTSASPIFGCVGKKAFSAATFLGGSKPAISFLNGKKTANVKLTKGAAAALCSDENGGDGQFYVLQRTSKSTNVLAYSRAGKRVFSSPALPKDVKASKLFLLPKFGSAKGAPAILNVINKSLELLIYDASTKKWTRQALGIASSSIRSAASGNESGKYRWIAVQGSGGQFYLIRLFADYRVRSVSSLPGVAPTLQEKLLL